VDTHLDKLEKLCEEMNYGKDNRSRIYFREQSNIIIPRLVKALRESMNTACMCTTVSDKGGCWNCNEIQSILEGA